MRVHVYVSKMGHPRKLTQAPGPTRTTCTEHNCSHTNAPGTPVKPQGRFLKLAVGWTASCGRRFSGDPGLCALLGRCLWNEGDLDRGMRYLVLGERPQELCDLIMQDVKEEKPRYFPTIRRCFPTISRRFPIISRLALGCPVPLTSLTVVSNRGTGTSRTVPCTARGCAKRVHGVTRSQPALPAAPAPSQRHCRRQERVAVREQG